MTRSSVSSPGWWPGDGGASARTGMVEAFDEERGLGTVADEAGHTYRFHCTAIADGSRSIAVGTRVVFLVGPGHLGGLEGRGLCPVS